jgi:hypothetical protein
MKGGGDTAVIDVNTIGTLLATVLTLIVFSFLYRDNKLYKLIEHIYLGFAIGVGAVMAKASVTSTALNPALGGAWIWVLPIALGLLFCFYFSKRYSWASRIPVAYLVGGASGLAISGAIKAQILDQIAGTITLPLINAPDAITAVNNLLMIVGVISTIFFFFFSTERKGVAGNLMQLGRIFVVVALGAAFGFIVMARMSLLIGRLQFLFLAPSVYLLPIAFIGLLIGIVWDMRKAHPK